MSDDRRYELAQWRDPEDDDPNRREPKIIRGLRRYSTLHNLHKSNDQEITLEHMKAMARFNGDYEMGMEGASPPGDSKLDRVDGSKSYDISQMRLDAATHFREAVEALGPSLFGFLWEVCFLNESVKQAGLKRGIHNQIAKGVLIAGLDRLRDHYNPPMLAVPVGAGYEFVDEEVRIGRYDRA